MQHKLTMYSVGEHRGTIAHFELKARNPMKIPARVASTLPKSAKEAPFKFTGASHQPKKTPKRSARQDQVKMSTPTT